MKKYVSYIAALALCSTVVFSPLAAQVSAKDNINKDFLSSTSSTSSNQSAEYEKNKLVIKSKSPLTSQQLNKINAKVFYTVSELNYTVLKFKNEKQMRSAVKQLNTYKTIQSINVSPIYKKFSIKDPKASKQYMHKAVKSVQAQKLVGKKKVKVAVIDSGIDAQHPELKANVIINKNSTNPLHIPNSELHGTHVAGIIAAKKGNLVGGYGINPNAQILGYDVFGEDQGATDYIISNAIIQATKDGAKVINMSLGSPYSSELLQKSIEYAYNKGVTVVAASGNFADDTKSYPASYNNVISVNASNKDNKLAQFSSYGVGTDITAPGNDIYSTAYQKRGSSYQSLSGTSMASPIVAGVASLILAKNPSLKPAQVKYIIEHTATDLGEKGFDHKYANGLINALAAVKFDSKKIPSLITKKWTDESILKDAKKVNLNEKITNSFTLSGEKHWYTTNVEKGQKIQISALGDKNTDLRLAINFYQNGVNDKSSINNVKEGFMEAKYIEAPFTGKLVIGVDDVNGMKNTSPYTLKIDTGDFPKDESSRENIMELDSTNKTITNQFMQPTDAPEGDEDILHFKAAKDELVEVKLSNIAGVYTNISVFDKKGFQLNNGTETTSTAPEDEDEEPIDAIIKSNSSLTSEDNTVSFETKKGEDYYIVLNNQEQAVPELPFDAPAPNNNDDLSEKPFVTFIDGPQASLIPYTLTLKSKEIPADEDSMTKQSMEDDLSDKYDSIPELITYFKNQGQPFEFNKPIKGYLNGGNDVDGYYVTPKESGIYSVDIHTKHFSTLPMVTLYAMKEVKNAGTDERLNKYKVTGNFEYGNFKDNHMYWSLQANTTYFVKVEKQDNFPIPFDGYELDANLVVANQEDKFEDNNTDATAKAIPASGQLEGNFSTVKDDDYYYYTAKKTGLVSLKFKLKGMPKKKDPRLEDLFTTPYNTDLIVIKDANKNGILEDSEKNNPAIYFEENTLFALNGSFEAKKDDKFFVILEPTAFESNLFSMLPYSLKLKNVVLKDEDANSIIKKNKPSKTISMKKNGKKGFTRSAYLNPGQINGDQDWFGYKATKKTTASIKLAVPDDLDGVISVYKNGRLITKIDSYGDGDTELKSIKITKGQYYFKVTDRFKRASAEAYKFSITTK